MYITLMISITFIWPKCRGILIFVSNVIFYPLFQNIFPHLGVVKLLLECGAQVNARNEFRSTPLLVASNVYNFQNSVSKFK